MYGPNVKDYYIYWVTNCENTYSNRNMRSIKGILPRSSPTDIRIDKETDWFVNIKKGV